MSRPSTGSLVVEPRLRRAARFGIIECKVFTPARDVFHSDSGMMRSSVLCLVVALLGFAFDAGAQSSCPPALRSPIRDDIEREDGMPSRQLLFAYERYVGRRPYWPKPTPQVVAELRVRLRAFVLDKTPDYVARNRAKIAQERWDKAFIADFDAAIQEMDAARSNDSETLRRIGLQWRDRHDTSSKSVGFRLLGIAADAGSMAAEIDIAHIGFAENSKGSTTSLGRLSLLRAARCGYGPAQREMMERHMTGDQLPRSDEKAYYWGLLARTSGTDVQAKLDQLQQRLTLDQRRTVQRWIDTDAWVRP